MDETYQRSLSRLSERLIGAIVEGWDWLKFKPPVVALTGLGFEVVDGQHTAIVAACHPEVATIPVIVVDGTDLPRRARAFVSHAVDRLQATPAQVFHAAVAGGDASAVEVRDVLERAGVTLFPHNHEGTAYRPGETMALGDVRNLVARRGAERAAEVLGALARAEFAPVAAEHVRAGEALLCDPDYADAFDAERLTVAMRTLTPAVLAEARELAAAKQLPQWRALTATLYRRAPKRPRPRAPAAQPARPSEAEPASPSLAVERLGTRVKPPLGVRMFAALGRIVMPSPELAAVVGAGPMLRSDAVAALSRYIDAHGLHDPADRRVVVAYTKLRAIFGRERVPASEMEGLFAPHLRSTWREHRRASTLPTLPDLRRAGMGALAAATRGPQQKPSSTLQRVRLIFSNSTRSVLFIIQSKSTSSPK